MSNLIQEMMKPFMATGLTTEQRIIIAEEIANIASANTRILETIMDMEDNKKAMSIMRGTEKIGEGAKQIAVLIS